MNQFLKIFAKLINGLVIAVLALMVLANVYTLVAQKFTGKPINTFLGFSHAVVLSGSMSDAIQVNDLIFTKASDTYETGDIITFTSGNSTVTHRIIEETDQGFITKGDANDAADGEPVSPEQIVGKVVAVVPGIGAVLAFCQTPLGMLLLILCMFLIIEVPAHFHMKRQEKN